MPNFLNGTIGSNFYQYKLGDGESILADTGYENDVDQLVFSGAGLTAANAVITRVGSTKDLKITFKNIPGSLLLKNQLATNYESNAGIERITFSDGISWNETQLWNAYLGAGAATDDVLEGGIGNDVLVGGKGNDTLDGGEGRDLYRYQLGDGDDVIADTGYEAQWQDRLVFSGAGLTAANAIVTRMGTTTDLKITFKNLAGSILLKNQISTNWSRNNGIEQITFSDGVFWNESKLWNAYLGAGLSTNDTLEGTIGNDILVGGKGNDYLDGSEGSDIYKYQLGDGDDTVFDTGYDKYKSDQLVFSGTGLTAANAIVTRMGTTTDLKISFKTSAGSVLLKNQLSTRWDHVNGVEQVTFSDGVLWNESQLWNAYLGAGAAIDDTLEGTIGNDVLLGGKGNDYLDGGEGSDIYKYQLGDGDDILFDTGYEKDCSDQLVFSGTGLTAANAVVTRIGTTTDLKITFKNIAGSVLLKNQFTNSWDNANGIERITFSDGVMWNEPQLWSAILGASTTTTNTIVGTGFNDTLVGSSGNDYFEGRRGNDILKGDGGADIYRYNLGDGDDILSDFSGYDLTLSYDQLLFSGAGLTAANAIVTHINNTNDLKITFKGIAGSVLLSEQVYHHTSQFSLSPNSTNYGVESVTFSDGVMWTESQLWNAYLGAGAATDDQLWGMASDDVIVGGKGNDYLNGWQGSDTYVYRLGDGDDTIVDSSNLNNTIDQIIFSGTGLTAANAIVTHIGNTNNLKISFKGIAGSILLVDQVYVHTSRFNVTSVIGDCGIERVTFSDGIVWNESQLWNAYLGAGLATDDQLWGMTSDDVIVGGKGNDYLNGWEGADTYRYQLGDGDDTLVDTGGDNVVDQLVFSGAGLTAANAIVTQIANTMDLKISFKNSAGSVLLKDQLDSFNNLYYNIGVESVTFSDGLTWDNAQMVSNYLELGASTNDTLQGTVGNDVLVGGKGNDILIGGTGADIYRYQLGDGDDTLSDFGSDNSSDQLILSGSGLTSVNVVITGETETKNLKISFKNTIGSIVLKEQLDSNYYNVANSGIESLTFSDGVTWNESQLVNAYLTAGAATDDDLFGTIRDDSLFGGKGNDFLTGRAGSDSFVFDGNGVFNPLNLGLDRITDFTTGTDKIVLSKSTFTALTSSVNTALNASEFAIINDATNGESIASGSTAKVVFNRANGDLFYNQNGATLGLGSGARFANLSGGASLAASDILLRA